MNFPQLSLKPRESILHGRLWENVSGYFRHICICYAQTLVSHLHHVLKNMATFFLQDVIFSRFFDMVH